MGTQRTGFAAIDQAHRSAREDSAIALEIGAPRLVVDLVSKNLTDVDCR